MLRRFLLQNLLKIRKILSFHLKFDCRLKPERIYRFLIVVNLKLKFDFCSAEAYKTQICKFDFKFKRKEPRRRIFYLASLVVASARDDFYIVEAFATKAE